MELILLAVTNCGEALWKAVEEGTQSAGLVPAALARSPGSVTYSGEPGAGWSASAASVSAAVR